MLAYMLQMEYNKIIKGAGARKGDLYGERI